MSHLGRLYRIVSKVVKGPHLRVSANVRHASFAQMSIYGAVGGSALGLAYSAYTHYNINNNFMLTKAPELKTIENVEVPDNIVITKKIRGTFNIPNTELTLFQYQTCPFCCKVRAFLDYHGFSYNVVEVDAVLRQSIKWSKYKKVPILLVKNENGYQQLNDSTLIISILSSYLTGIYSNVDEIVQYYPMVTFNDENGKEKSDVINKYFLMLKVAPKESIKAKMSEERKWRKWSDDVLVHTLSPNVYRTHAEALQAFNWFSETGEWRQHFPGWEVSIMINVGAFVMWMIGNKLKKKYGLKNDVRLSLYDECNVWLKEIRKNDTEFMGGSKPNLSDLAVYGVLSSIEGCDAFRDLLDNTNIRKWYYGVKDHITSNKGTVAT